MKTSPPYSPFFCQGGEIYGISAFHPFLCWYLFDLLLSLFIFLNRTQAMANSLLDSILETSLWRRGLQRLEQRIKKKRFSSCCGIISLIIPLDYLSLAFFLQNVLLQFRIELENKRKVSACLSSTADANSASYTDVILTQQIKISDIVKKKKYLLVFRQERTRTTIVNKTEICMLMYIDFNKKKIIWNWSTWWLQ